MNLTTLSGDIFLTLNIDSTITYTYNELKIIFLETIKTDEHYVIIQDYNQIFTDLYQCH